MTLQEVWSLLNLYNSVFSGEQIDEAIGLILNGGVSAAVAAAEASAAAAAKSASEAAGSAAESGSAETNAQNAAAQAAESANQAKRYAEQAHAIAGEKLVFSVNGVQADETGNVQIPTGGVKTINGETPDNDGDITLDASKVNAIPANAKGAPNGVAELGAGGKVPAAQMPSLDDYGAFPVIDARSSNYDMEAVLRSGIHFGVYRINDQTIGTPYSDGVTNRKYGLVFSFASSASYGVQFAILAGAECPFYRLLDEAGGVYRWSPVYNGWRPPIVTEVPGATQINLRWENASPTSAFPAQTINFGLDIFDMYIVIARQSTTQSMCVSVIQKVGKTAKLVNLSYSSGVNMHVRTIDSFSDGSLKFYDALSNGVTDNSSLIPLYVYGIGGV